MPKISDIEKELKTFLVAQGITDPIFLQAFPRDSAARGYMVRREGSGPLPERLDIDNARVFVVARETHPHESFLMQKAVADILQGLNTTPMGMVKALHAEILSGPDRNDDTETNMPQHIATYIIRVLL